MTFRRTDPLPPRPRLSVRGARAAYVGPGLALAPHTSAVATVAVGLGTPFQLREDVDSQSPGSYRETTLALILPNMQHHLVARGPMAFLYLDAAGDDYARLRPSELSPSHAPIADAARDPNWDADTLFEPLGIPRRPPPPVGLARALRALDARPEDFPLLGDAAALAGLSESRFRHVLREVTGLTFRRYRRWRRMVAVARALAAGQSLTTAAHATGWASSAHLSHAFRVAFGLCPSDLVRRGIAFDLDEPETEVTEGDEEGATSQC